MICYRICNEIEFVSSPPSTLDLNATLACFGLLKLFHGNPGNNGILFRFCLSSWLDLTVSQCDPFGQQISAQSISVQKLLFNLWWNQWEDQKLKSRRKKPYFFLSLLNKSLITFDRYINVYIVTFYKCNRRVIMKHIKHILSYRDKIVHRVLDVFSIFSFATFERENRIWMISLLYFGRIEAVLNALKRTVK